MFRVFRHYVPRAFVALAVGEFLLLVASVYLGVALRFLGQEPPYGVEPLLPKALAFAAVMLLSMTAMGLYQRNLREGLGGVLIRLGLSAALALVAMAVLFYVLPGLFLGRGAFGLAFLVALLGLALVRAVFMQVADLEALQRRVLVLGAGPRAAEIGRRLRRKADRRGCHIVGYVHVAGEQDAVDPRQVIRHDVPLLELARRMQIDEIVVAVEDRRKRFPLHEILDCRMSGIEVLDLLTFLERQLRRVELDLMQPSWLIFSDGFRYGLWRAVSKRLFDVVVSALLLLLLWPVMAAAALAIYLETGRPVLYRQVRVGENWRPFQLLKFRSMVQDAEADGKPRWAAANDHRVTPVGRFLRRARIDELPQLLNVLRGDMSFVGPRPERPAFVERLAREIPYYAERSRVKPGITGWAQVCYPYGSSEEDAARKLQYDLYYVKNYSLFLDLLILLQTAEVVLWGRGAR